MLFLSLSKNGSGQNLNESLFGKVKTVNEQTNRHMSSRVRILGP